MAVDPVAVEQSALFDSVPGYGNLGGIWAWGRVSAEEDDSVIYTAVGNSRVYSDECRCFVDDAGYGNSVVALTPDLSEVVDSDQPNEVPGTGDNDFGAAPLLFQPKGCPPLAAAKNKVGALFVWARTHLADGPYARFELTTRAAHSSARLATTPSAGRSSSPRRSSTPTGRAFPTEAQTISPMIEAAGTVFGGDRSGTLYAFAAGNADRQRAR